MGIDALQYSNNFYNNRFAFGGLTQRQATYQGVPNTTARIEPSYKPTAEQYELAEKIANGELNGIEATTTSPYTQGRNVESKGSGWDGFNAPEHNDNCELRPVITSAELGNKLDFDC